MVNERPRVTRGRAVLLLIGALLVTGVLGFGASRLGDPELGRTASPAAARATPGPSAFDLALTLPVGAPADELPRTLPEKTGVSRFLVGSIDVTLRDEALWASPLPDDDWLIATAPTRDGRARQVDLMRAFPAHPAESLTSTSGVFALSPDRRSVVTVIWSADGNPNSYVLTVLDIATGAETATRTLTGEPRRLVAWTAEGIIVQGRARRSSWIRTCDQYAPSTRTSPRSSPGRAVCRWSNPDAGRAPAPTWRAASTALP